jgi:hypothetical protein
MAGAAMLRFASSAMLNSAAMPGCPNPDRQSKKKARVRDASTQQVTSPCGQLTAPQETVSRTFRNPGKCRLSVQSNIMDMADVSGIKIARYVQEDDKAARAKPGLRANSRLEEAGN